MSDKESRQSFSHVDDDDEENSYKPRNIANERVQNTAAG